MQSFFRLSAGLVAVGVLLWASATIHAMPVTGPDSDIQMSIGGFVNASTGFYTPAESGGEQAPSYVATSSEYRINLTVGTDKLNAWAQLWDRNSNSALGNVDQQHVQVNWMPVDNLQIHAGKLQYVEWADRATQWENYYGWTPAVAGTGPDFMGYIETNDGIDINYSLGGDMKAGVAYMTEGKVSGTGTAIATDGDGDGTAESGVVASTIIPHFQMKGDLQILASYYMETLEGTSDGWANSGDVSNTLLVIDFKMALGDGSFVKADLLNRVIEEGSPGADNGETTDTVIALAYSMGLGDATAFVELSSGTQADDDDDDSTSLWARLGYYMNVAAGSKMGVEYFQNTTETNGGDAVTESWLGLNLFQSY